MSRQRTQMGDPRTDDVINPERFSVTELRSMLFEEEGPLSRPLALLLLG